MEAVYEVHLDRVKTAVLKKYTAAMIAKWVCDKTLYAGQPYSFLDHEYQEKILSEVAPEINTQKCSQVGVSEATARKALALVNVLNPYTVAYTLPTAHFAGTFTKTRIDPIIEGSPTLKSAIHKTNDNNEVKQFGDSFLWVRGAASSNAPISIPCDHLIHDEYDFSDQEVLGQYFSRLTHSKWKRIDRFSTPTLPDFGINKAFKQSKRWYNLCKCDHCGHYFMPDYYKHVKIPGYTKDLREIDKGTLTRIRWEEAVLICPSCGKEPSLQVDHREWVCENPDEKHVAVGIQVSPFDAPNIIKPSYLVKASTAYDRIQDFINFNLGLPAEDSEATLTREDFNEVFVRSEAGSNNTYVMGVDVGNIYHFVVGAVDAWGDVFAVHSEKVGMGRARERYRELRREYRIGAAVIDSGPHAETVMALQEEDPNLYASVYMRSKSILTHTVIDKEQDDKYDGQEFVRQVNVNRNRALDAYMEFIRSNHLRIKDNPEKEEIIAHHTSMKRVKNYENDSGEMVFTWQKTDGIDHYHHAFLYMWIASRIKGLGRPLIVLPVATAHKFRLKQK